MVGAYPGASDEGCQLLITPGGSDEKAASIIGEFLYAVSILRAINCRPCRATWSSNAVGGRAARRPASPRIPFRTWSERRPPGGWAPARRTRRSSPGSAALGQKQRDDLSHVQAAGSPHPMTTFDRESGQALDAAEGAVDRQFGLGVAEDLGAHAGGLDLIVDHLGGVALARGGDPCRSVRYARGGPPR